MWTWSIVHEKKTTKTAVYSGRKSHISLDNIHYLCDFYIWFGLNAHFPCGSSFLSRWEAKKFEIFFVCFVSICGRNGHIGQWIWVESIVVVVWADLFFFFLLLGSLDVHFGRWKTLLAAFWQRAGKVPPSVSPICWPASICLYSRLLSCSDVLEPASSTNLSIIIISFFFFEGCFFFSFWLFFFSPTSPYFLLVVVYIYSLCLILVEENCRPVSCHGAPPLSMPKSIFHLYRIVSIWPPGRYIFPFFFPLYPSVRPSFGCMILLLVPNYWPADAVCPLLLPQYIVESSSSSTSPVLLVLPRTFIFRLPLLSGLFVPVLPSGLSSLCSVPSLWRWLYFLPPTFIAE